MELSIPQDVVECARICALLTELQELLGTAADLEPRNAAWEPVCSICDHIDKCPRAFKSQPAPVAP